MHKPSYTEKHAGWTLSYFVQSVHELYPNAPGAMVEIVRDDKIHASFVEVGQRTSVSETLDLIDKLRNRCFDWIKAHNPSC